MLEKVMTSMEEFSTAHDTDRDVGCKGVEVERGWRPPEGHLIKVNTDAAVFKDGSVGCGGVIRDSVGDVMGAMCECIEGNFDIDVAEAYAARRGLLVALEAGMTNLVLESDCLKLVLHIQRGHIECSSFGMMVADILELSGRCIAFLCKHVKREGNRVAHKLAHLSKNFEELRVWLEEVPTEALPLVLADVE